MLVWEDGSVGAVEGIGGAEVVWVGGVSRLDGGGTNVG